MRLASQPSPRRNPRRAIRSPVQRDLRISVVIVTAKPPIRYYYRNIYGIITWCKADHVRLLYRYGT